MSLPTTDLASLQNQISQAVSVTSTGSNLSFAGFGFIDNSGNIVANTLSSDGGAISSDGSGTLTATQFSGNLYSPTDSGSFGFNGINWGPNLYNDRLGSLSGIIQLDDNGFYVNGSTAIDAMSNATFANCGATSYTGDGSGLNGVLNSGGGLSTDTSTGTLLANCIGLNSTPSPSAATDIYKDNSDNIVLGYQQTTPIVCMSSFFPPQFTTSFAPGYVLGLLYFDTTMNKLRIGGALGWETITSV